MQLGERKSPNTDVRVNVVVQSEKNILIIAHAPNLVTYLYPHVKNTDKNFLLGTWDISVNEKKCGYRNNCLWRLKTVVRSFCIYRLCPSTASLSLSFKVYVCSTKLVLFHRFLFLILRTGLCEQFENAVLKRLKLKEP